MLELFFVDVCIGEWGVELHDLFPAVAYRSCRLTRGCSQILPVLQQKPLAVFDQLTLIFILLLAIDGTVDLIYVLGHLLDDMEKVEDHLRIGKMFLY